MKHASISLDNPGCTSKFTQVQITVAITSLTIWRYFTESCIASDNERESQLNGSLYCELRCGNLALNSLLRYSTRSGCCDLVKRFAGLSVTFSGSREPPGSNGSIQSVGLDKDRICIFYQMLWISQLGYLFLMFLRQWRRYN